MQDKFTAEQIQIALATADHTQMDPADDVGNPIVYWTDVGQRLIMVHQATQDCLDHGCVLHNPTDPNQDLPTIWTARGMGRLCEHMYLHPDYNHVNFTAREYGVEAALAVEEHECDGCCRPKL